MPTRPVLYAAPLAAVALLALYYYGRYRDCHFQASLRQSAYRLAADRLGGAMNLTEATPFAWDKAIVGRITAPGAGREAPDCPLGWDWPRGRRAELAAAQRLNAIVYLHRGRVVGYVELDRAVLDFGGAGERRYATGEALFQVRESGNGFLLSPARPAGGGEEGGPHSAELSPDSSGGKDVHP